MDARNAACISLYEHIISCSLSSLRQMMTPMANFLPLRGGCWSSGLRTFQYSSEAFSRLVECDHWILREEGSKGGRKVYEYQGFIWKGGERGTELVITARGVRARPSKLYNCQLTMNFHLLTYNVHTSYV